MVDFDAEAPQERSRDPATWREVCARLGMRGRRHRDAFRDRIPLSRYRVLPCARCLPCSVFLVCVSPHARADVIAHALRAGAGLPS